MTKEELLYGIALKSAAGIGDRLAKTLITYCGSAEAVFKEPKPKLLKIPGIGDKAAKAIASFSNFDKIKEEIEWAVSKNIKILFYFDKDYPQRLKECADAPLFLFVKGSTDLNNQRVLSIAGTRNATAYGKEFCRSLAKALQGTDCLILSGLAFGIDAHAHKEALNNNLPTAAVLGHGLKTISPPANKNLAKEILETDGSLITEHFSYETPVPENFPKRNRIMAGMCDGLIVVESGIKGGSMITADLAWGYDREIFALPGRISDTYSLGCNKLINNNRAICIENAEKLVEYLGWKNNKTTSLRIAPPNLTEEEKKIYNLLRADKKHIDTLHTESGIPQGNLSMLLLDMELRGVVISLPGKMYKL